LGRVLPGLFRESHWSESLGVTDPRSTEHQVSLARRVLAQRPADERVFLYVNVSAIHQPNRHYSDAAADCVESHAAALEYVDGQLGPLFDVLRERGPTFCLVSSDHGTAYGEDGLHGHRINHAVVTTVPYAEFVL
jgi:arylsulfatase A-like enzyme